MTIRALLCCTLVLAGADAGAVEWRQPVAAEGTRPLELSAVLPDGDGYVLAGNRWVRVDAQGRAVAESDPHAAVVDVSFARITPLAPDRFLVQDGRTLDLQWVDGGGRLRAAADYGLPLDRIAGLDGGGGLWLADVSSAGPQRSWGRMQADGRLRAVAMPPDATHYNGFALFAPWRDAAAAFALYRADAAVHLAKVGYEAVEWWQAPPAEVQFDDLALLDDGELLVVGRLGPARGILWLGRYGRGGELRWQRSYPDLVPGGYPLRAQRLAGDRTVIAAPDLSQGAPSTRWLVAFDAQGTLLWRREAAGEEFHGYVQDAPEANEPAFAYWTSSVDSTPDTEAPTGLVHVAADGRTLARLSGGPESHAALLRDGSLVQALLPIVPGTGPLAASVQRHRLDGSVQPGPALGTLLPAFRVPLRGALLDNGDSVGLSLEPDGTLQLRSFDAQGGLRWQRSLQARIDPHRVSELDRELERNARVAFGPDRICVGPTYTHLDFQGQGQLLAASHVECVRRADGAPIHASLAARADASRYVPLPAYAVLHDGRVVLAETDDTDVYRTVVSADGTQLQRQRLASADIGIPGRDASSEGRNAVAAFAADGSLAVFLSDRSSARFAAVTAGPQGAASQAFVHALDYGALLRVEPLPGGDWLLLSRLVDRHLLTRLAPDGSQRWSRALDVRHDPGLQLASGLRAVEFAAGADHVLVATHALQHADGRTLSTVMALHAATGATAWSQARTLLPGRGVRTLDLDAPRGLALVVRDSADRPVLTLHALSDGSERGQRPLDCGAAPGCHPLDLVLAADGSLRAFGAGFDAVRYELDSTLQPPAIGQPALLGTWYAPGTTGQGLLIDYSAASGDLLAGWFTYDAQGRHDAGGLRWFTLGGVAAPNATVADLDIYFNADGEFASGPRTTATRIGSARLRMSDCNTLVLGYRFVGGEHAGLQGEIPLVRLTPSVYACTEGDGRVLPPAQAAPTPGTGLSATQSGAWYALDQSGQGLLFDLRPPGASMPGHLVGGWFTYDPAGLADDAAAQHWLMLDGDLVPGAAGTYTVPIYRAVGGRFDLRPTRNVHPVGRAELRFDGCAAATLDYRFDDSDLAAEFAALQGRLSLVRLLPCPG